MIYSVDRWALSGNLWILVSVASLSMFLFIIVYLYILYPEKAFTLQPAAASAAAAAAATSSSSSSISGATPTSAPISKIVSADGEISTDSNSNSDPHTELSRFFQRVIGHGKLNENGELNTKLRPFRSLGFLFSVLPSAYMMYRNKIREEAVST